MTRETFQKGIAIFSACISKFEVDKTKMDVWFTMIQHLSDQTFLQAVKKICETVPNIYAGTNIVALILNTAEQVKNSRTNISGRIALEEGFTEREFANGKERLKVIKEKLSGKMVVN